MSGIDGQRKWLKVQMHLPVYVDLIVLEDGTGFFHLAEFHRSKQG